MLLKTTIIIRLSYICLLVDQPQPPGYHYSNAVRSDVKYIVLLHV